MKNAGDVGGALLGQDQSPPHTMDGTCPNVWRSTSHPQTSRAVEKTPRRNRSNGEDNGTGGQVSDGSSTDTNGQRQQRIRVA